MCTGTRIGDVRMSPRPLSPIASVFSSFTRSLIPSEVEADTIRRMQLSFRELLKQTRSEVLANAADPWRLRLERIRGKVGDDGIERISTQTVFDHLEVLQRSRGSGACRRLARVMRELGWTPVRVRDLTRGGYKEQIRGYCRDARCVSTS